MDVRDSFKVEMKTGEWLYLIGALEVRYPQSNGTIEKFFQQIMDNAYGSKNGKVTGL